MHHVNHGQRVDLASCVKSQTSHAYLYGLLGQLTEDRMMTAGAGIDAAVRRIQTTWDDLGRRNKVASCNGVTGAAWSTR